MCHMTAFNEIGVSIPWTFISALRIMPHQKVPATSISESYLRAGWGSTGSILWAQWLIPRAGTVEVKCIKAEGYLLPVFFFFPKSSFKDKDLPK